MEHWRGPVWLPGGHLQTLWPALASRAHGDGPPPQWRRERWNTSDGDFIDVDFIDAKAPDAPCVVMFHGLEGSSQSPYARAFASTSARGAT